MVVTIRSKAVLGLCDHLNCWIGGQFTKPLAGVYLLTEDLLSYWQVPDLD
jgi:hypothetical protein